MLVGVCYARMDQLAAFGREIQSGISATLAAPGAAFTPRDCELTVCA